MKYLSSSLFCVSLLLGQFAHANPCAPKNPCAISNPCASKTANPCAPKNPCKVSNPCASKTANPCAAAKGIDPKLVTRPKDTKLLDMPPKEAMALGEQLWLDTKMSSNGLACNSCHVNNAAFKTSFAEDYPHAVQMADNQAGVKLVHLDEMVQFCMLVPMAMQPFPWDSKQLAALTAYTAEQQKTFQEKHKKTANPCGK